MHSRANLIHAGTNSVLLHEFVAVLVALAATTLFGITSAVTADALSSVYALLSGVATGFATVRMIHVLRLARQQS